MNPVMPAVLHWNVAEEQQAFVAQAVQALTHGNLVVLPTDAGYMAAASIENPGALEQLAALSGKEDFVVAFAEREQALTWAPAMSPLGRRLAKRCWPGPVALVVEPTPDSAVGTLADEVRQQLCGDGLLRLTVPAYEAIWLVLREKGPLALATPPRCGSGEAISQVLGDKVALVLDDGPIAPEQTLSQVRLVEQGWEMLREGVVPATDIRQQTACLVVFVCTGNTCRSPMAEALCKKLLAEKLGCSIDQLPDRGFVVISAGLSAAQGDQAAPEGVMAVRELGGDLPGHASRPLTEDVVEQADFLFTMTRGHLTLLRMRFPNAGTVPCLLSQDGADIADPIGGDLDVYRHCAKDILCQVERVVLELLKP